MPRSRCNASSAAEKASSHPALRTHGLQGTAPARSPVIWCRCPAAAPPARLERWRQPPVHGHLRAGVAAAAGVVGKLTAIFRPSDVANTVKGA